MLCDQGEMISNFQKHTDSNLDLRFKKTQKRTTSNFNILSEDFYLDCRSLSRNVQNTFQGDRRALWPNLKLALSHWKPN